MDKSGRLPEYDDVYLKGGDIKIRILLLMEWRDYFAISTIAHTVAANRYSRISEITRIIITILTIFVAVFAANRFLSDSSMLVRSSWDIIFSGLGGLAAILFAVDSQLNYHALANLHKQCSKESHNLKRKIGRYICFDDVPNNIIHSINKEAHYIENHYPITTKSIWEKARKNYTNPDRIKRKRYELELLKYIREKHGLNFDIPE